MEMQMVSAISYIEVPTPGEISLLLNRLDSTPVSADQIRSALIKFGNGPTQTLNLISITGVGA